MEKSAWRIVLVSLLGIFASIPHVSYAQFTTCDTTYQKMGCFKEGHTNMEMIISDRDGKGVQLDWTQMGKSVHSLVCRCAAGTRDRGYHYFSIRFWAECWTGQSISQLNSLNKNVISTECSNTTFQPCMDDTDQECVGKAHNEYMYSLAYWSKWEDWSQCSASCDNGTQTRTRNCNALSNGDNDCTGAGSETQPCKEMDCPAYWSEWEAWSQCSVSCDQGTRTRTRKCNAGSNGNTDCTGEESETQACKEMDCPAYWSEWEAWSQCSVPCDQGTQTRTRKCNAGSSGVSDCTGPGSQTQGCNEMDCPGCEWIEKKFGIGSKAIPISNIKSKEDCYNGCLRLKKVVIDAVNFYATTNKCFCVVGIIVSSDDDKAIFCSLDYGSVSWNTK